MAAAGSRTLKLSILADVDNLKKNLGVGATQVDSFGSKVTDFGKKAGLAFAAAAAAAGAYAIKIGVDGVKAAIADEAAQVKLAGALRNATGATDEQIASVEKQILKMSLASGISDDQLRPALQRLSISTEDATKAQDLLALAMDISTATGKPLEGVANALGKAYDGNTGALGKLGVGLSTAELKTMSFTDTQKRLSDLFGGAADRNANTFAGRMQRLTVTIDEAKEGIGAALLPILEKLVGYFTTYVVPIVEKLSNAFSNKGDGIGANVVALGNTLTSVFRPIWDGLVSAFNSVKDAISGNSEAFLAFGKLIADYVAPVLSMTLGAALKIVGSIAGTVINVIGGIIGAITAAVEGAIAVVNWLINKYNSIPVLPNIPTIPTGTAPKVTIPTAPSVGGGSTPKIPTVTPPSGGSSGSSGGSSGGSGGGGSMKVAAAATAAANVVSSNFNPGGFRLAESRDSGTTINLTVTGAFDKEGTARTIVETLNDSFYRGTGGAGALQIA